jgi:hypothetical protein
MSKVLLTKMKPRKMKMMMEMMLVKLLLLRHREDTRAGPAKPFSRDSKIYGKIDSKLRSYLYMNKENNAVERLPQVQSASKVNLAMDVECLIKPGIGKTWLIDSHDG